MYIDRDIDIYAIHYFILIMYTYINVNISTCQCTKMSV